jgi:hypothetical protein
MGTQILDSLDSSRREETTHPHRLGGGYSLDLAQRAQAPVGDAGIYVT